MTHQDNPIIRLMGERDAAIAAKEAAELKLESARDKIATEAPTGSKSRDAYVQEALIESEADEEAARWQERIEGTIRSYGLEPIDASGNGSGDPLDWTDDQVGTALAMLEEQRDEARGDRDRLSAELAATTTQLSGTIADRDQIARELSAAVGRAEEWERLYNERNRALRASQDVVEAARELASVWAESRIGLGGIELRIRDALRALDAAQAHRCTCEDYAFKESTPERDPLCPTHAAQPSEEKPEVRGIVSPEESAALHAKLRFQSAHTKHWAAECDKLAADLQAMTADRDSWKVRQKVAEESRDHWEERAHKAETALQTVAEKQNRSDAEFARKWLNGEVDLSRKGVNFADEAIPYAPLVSTDTGERKPKSQGGLGPFGPYGMAVGDPDYIAATIASWPEEETSANVMDAPGGPQCFCGRPSQYQDGSCDLHIAQAKPSDADISIKLNEAGMRALGAAGVFSSLKNAGFEPAPPQPEPSNKSRAEQKRPPPPEELVGALHDRVHKPGRLISATPLRPEYRGEGACFDEPQPEPTGRPREVRCIDRDMTEWHLLQECDRLRAKCARQRRELKAKNIQVRAIKGDYMKAAYLKDSAMHVVDELRKELHALKEREKEHMRREAPHIAWDRGVAACLDRIADHYAGKGTKYTTYHFAGCSALGEYQPPGEYYCACCDGEWGLDETETHAPGCLAAPEEGETDGR